MEKIWKISSLTPLQTGGVNGRTDRVYETGIMGSLRWWYEVLVRGLGGKACDPTAKEVRCPQDSSKKPTDPGHHCVVCELFGCTGWARKFRLMVVDENGGVIQDQIRAGQIFALKFIPLRQIRPEEWCLLDLTLRLIDKCGAIGGKTVFKPSEEWGIADLGAEDLDDSSGQVIVHHARRGLPLQGNDVILEIEGTQVASLTEVETLLRGRRHGDPLTIMVQRRGSQTQIDAWVGKRHHQDFGLIAVEARPQGVECTREQIEAYVKDDRWCKGFDNSAFSWASLQHFWCVKRRYLARQDADTSSFNFVIGRPEPKNQSSQGDSWLAGRRPNRQRNIDPESKKVFSFKEPENARRTFGFVQNQDGFQEIMERLKVLRDGNGNGRKPDPGWKDFDPEKEFIKGEQILERLFS
ncbi:type III-B CRISPR module RAMP protein Cmr1 [Rhodothermus profundi]|nr:type III-B CRISPR module RAMP protein Cmr1 [Rhodothermus profundi]